MAPSLSELEAARCLAACGFTGARFIEPGPGRRSADLVAERAGERWAVEVRGATRPLRADAAFEPVDGRPLPYPTLEAYFALAWSEKRGQLEATRAAERCARGLLLVVAEGEPGPPWLAALERAWKAAGSPDGTSFGVAAKGRLRALFPS